LRLSFPPLLPFFYQNLQLRQQLTIQPTPVSSIIPSPTTDPTADWKTFVNTKYFYSFRYPQNHNVVGSGMDGSLPETKPGVTVLNFKADEFPNESRLSVSVFSDGKALNIRAQEHFDKIINYPVQTGKTEVVSEMTNTKFLGLGAFVFTLKGNLYIDGSSEGISEIRERKYVWVQRESTVYLIMVDESEATNQILSTFIFLD
jgi:hypothetical protein